MFLTFRNEVYMMRTPRR